MNIKIDAELKALIPPLAPDEYKQLEANIIKDGCRDPLVVWHGTLIDGHNRHEICARHGIKFDTVEMEFDSIAHARIWMRSNQQGRRNLNPAWQIEMELGNKADLLEIGRRAMAAGGGDKVSEYARAGLSFCDKPATFAALTKFDDNTEDPPVPFTPTPQPVNTRVEIAKAAGVSTGQVGMAEQVKKKAPELWEKAKAGEVSISAAYKEVNKHVHVAQNSGENEWYTPAEYIESARAVMGSIDTDPASSEIANATVNAYQFFTKDDDGLTRGWRGNVWMNPPYAQPLISQFSQAISKKFTDGEITQAIALVNNATETAWFQLMAEYASAVCFPKSRIRFLDPNGKPGAPLQGQAILYFGKFPVAFRDEFQKYGKTFA